MVRRRGREIKECEARNAECGVNGEKLQRRIVWRGAEGNRESSLTRFVGHAEGAAEALENPE
jgi:hypothetical protein